MPGVTRLLAALGLACLAPFACSRREEAVTVYTSVDDVFARPVLEGFERETGIRVRAVFDAEAVKTTGLYHRLLAERERPSADVFWSSEPARTVQLAGAGILAPYASPSAAGIPGSLRSGAALWTGFAARARVLVYNVRRVSEAERPRAIRDLLEPRFRGEAAVSDPLFGTMATHAGALRAILGKEAMEDLFRALVESGVKVLPGNSVVRDRVASGELKVGLTDTDDAAVAVAKGLPLGIVFPDQNVLYPGLGRPLGAFVFPNTVALVAGGPRPELGRKLIDHLLRPETEAALARSESAQIPVRPGIPGPAPIEVPADLLRMEVALEDVVRGIEESAPFLRKLFGR